MIPYIICHMLSSVDGKIDGAAIKAVTRNGEYEATGAEWKGNAWICGRTTMQQHFADDEPFVSASNTTAGPQPVHVARRAGSYAISVDTLGKLRWSAGDVNGDHSSSVDLCKAVDLLGQQFGIRSLLLEGGGHINGTFLEADLVDEVSLLVVPGIDGRHDIRAVFDGVNLSNKTAIPLKLKSVQQRENDALWIRYEVVRS
jgi:2,5-diamino-6-(ribosylamino)-4(3H)-pyrimidinone 5'-phosphate reductase